MQCPRCKDTMKALTVNGIRVNECFTCQGMWFSRGKLDDVKDEVLPEMGWLDIDAWMDQVEFSFRKGPRICPQCKDSFMTTVHDKQSATEIDICTQCDGVWLAAGQFLRLINALLDEANQKTAPELAKLSLQQAKELLTSGDTALSDWQDFKTVLQLLKHRIFIEHPKFKSLMVGLQKSLPL